MMDPQCVFCRIIAGQIPASRVLETADALAFRDVNPQAPTHILVVPREHVAGIDQLAPESPIWNGLIGAAQQVARQEGLSRGYRLVINSGEDAGQSVAHLHLHLLGGRALSWPPG